MKFLYRYLIKNIYINSLLGGLLLFSAISVKSLLFSQSTKFYGQKITRIDFKGNANIKNSELLALIQARPGMILNAEMVNADIKSLFAQGSIANVRIEGETYKDGVGITFVIEEKPIVTSISFRGLKTLTQASIEDLIPLKEGKVYSEDVVIKSMDLILGQAREKGLLNASINFEKVNDKEKGNGVKIIFNIDEGEEIRVGKINYIGFKDVNIQSLSNSLKLHEEDIFEKGEFKEGLFAHDKSQIVSFLNEKGYLDARLIDAKKEIKWDNPVKKDKRIIIITYKVELGELYYFNGYDIEWDKRFVNEETNKPVFAKKEFEKNFEQTDGYLGTVFNNSKYLRDKGIISYLYNEKGYIYSRVLTDKTVINLNKEEIDKLANSDVQKENEAKGVDYYHIALLKKIYEKNPERRNHPFVHTKFIIQEGAKGYIESIIIKGNEKTQDKVIRREFLVKEGDLFNAKLVQRSRERIYNLGYFSEVNVDARPGTREGFMNLVVTVVEQLTGSMSVGGGYGTLTGFSIFMQLQEKNLNGTGQSVNGKLEFGLKRAALNVSWTEPWMFDKPWSLTLGGEFFHTQLLTNSLDPLSYSKAARNINPGSSSGNNGSSLSSGQILQTVTNEDAFYYRDKFGISITVGHQLGTYWKHFHGLSPSFSQITNPSSKVDDIIYLESDLGWQFQNKLVNGISFDNRDNVFSPTQGADMRLNIDIVGNFLGGTDHYNRYSFSGTFYWWPTDFTFFNTIRIGELRRWRFVFEHHFSATFTQQTKPLYNNQDAFENPYIESYDRLYLGGFEGVRGWAAYDSGFPTYWNQNGGASHRLLFDTELRIPIEPSIIWAVLFFDMGALFNDRDQYYIDKTTPQAVIDGIDSTRFTIDNLFNLSYYRYSVGFGFRLQIPVMPMRLYFAQRLLWDNGRGWFVNDPRQTQLEVVFAIGDYRF